jgi:hypothetical protein
MPPKGISQSPGWSEPFLRATFDGRVGFRRATFSGFTYLHHVRFNAGADFEQANFKDSVTFADSIFRQAARFESVDSAAAFSLANAVFEQVPGFFSTTFKGPLRLDNIATPRYLWLGYTPDKDATARFRELRRRAVEAQDRERELEFFAQEIRSSCRCCRGRCRRQPCLDRARSPVVVGDRTLVIALPVMWRGCHRNRHRSGHL